MDLTIPITGGTAFAAVVGYLGKQAWKAASNKIAAYDKHLEECHQKAIQHARVEERLNALGNEMKLQISGVETKIDGLCDRFDDYTRRR